MKTEYEIRITQLTVNKTGEPIFSPHATIIEIEDQAGGEYLAIRQDSDDCKTGEIFIELDQWPKIKEAIEMLLPTLGNHE